MATRPAWARAAAVRIGRIRLAIALLLACGCAYYNTFYTARKHYNDAEKQHLESGQEHPSPTALDLYQRSIDRSQKVITHYPDSKWVDDARYLIGMAYLRREEWDKAYSTFEEMIAKHPGSSLVPDARLNMGIAQLGRGEWKEAEKTFQALLTDFPRSKLKGDVVFHLARGHARRREYRPAVAGLSQLLAGDSEETMEAEAREARGEAYLALDAPDSALADFEALVRLRNRPDQRFEAELQVGQCLERLGRLPQALGHYARLEREMPGPNHLPRTLLARGRALGDLGRHNEALAIYERVIREFPTSSFSAQALYQTGVTQELHLHDVERAKEAYAKVRETAPGSEFATLAEERRQSLDLFGRYREEIAGGGEEEKKAQAGFLMAELSLFRLRKVEEALALYQAVERDHPQSSFAPKAAFAAAWIQEHELGDSTAAVAAYRRVFDRYPGTEYGVHAGVRSGVLAADSLSIHLGRVMGIKATEDSLAAVARLKTAGADSLAVLDSLAVAARGEAGADTLQVAASEARRDSLAGSHADSARMVAGDDSSRALDSADSLREGEFDPYSNVPPEERHLFPDSLGNRRRFPPRER